MTNVLVVLNTPLEAGIARYGALFEKYSQTRGHVVAEHSELSALMRDADVFIGFGNVLGQPDVADRLLRSAVKLRWIQSLGTGVDTYTRLPSLRSDVLLTNTRGVHGKGMVEAALALMLSLSRDLPKIFRDQAAQRWEHDAPRLLRGRTVGIVGIGAISEVIAPCLTPLGMHVIGFTSSPRTVTGFDEVWPISDVLALAGRLDFLILVTPLNAATRHIVDERVLAAMKPTSYLLNLGRGELVDEAALLASLRNGGIAGAALDVFAQEPLPVGHPLWTLPNVIVTPHVAGYYDTYDDETLAIVERNLDCFLRGATAEMLNIVPH